MIWRLSHRFDPNAVAIADRHYNRQKPGTPQCMPPGRALVLLTDTGCALWGTSWPVFAQHAWAGAWVNNLFRNEGRYLSSHLIERAVAITRQYYGKPPELGIITFVDASKVRSTNPGYCYLMAGWKHVGWTKSGKKVFQQLPDEMPAAASELIMRAA